MVNNKITVTRVLNHMIFLTSIIVLNEVKNKVVDGFFVDYTENSELIQQRVGYNISLQCSIKELIDKSKINDISYNWYFKQCGEGSGGALNCYDTNDDEDWTLMPCENNVCKSELQLKNVTEKYSGLYKCTVMPKLGDMLDVKLVRTFQLDIKNTSMKIPEFLDAFPLNRTVNTGGQAVFQCLVYSEEYPTIKWFRRLEHSDNVHSLIYYNGQAYELLLSTREKPTAQDVYLSKLILNDVRLQDEGYYACVAISFRGHNIREAYLEVHVPDDNLSEYWEDYEEEDNVLRTTGRNKFWILFLMPVGLALLPLTVWLCYIIHKRYRPNNLKIHIPSDQQCMLG